MTEVLALVAILVAVATVGVMFYLDRKRNPRREFTYEVTASPLVSKRVRGLDLLEVSYDGKLLPQPYLVTVQVGSTGRGDIPKSSFDSPVLFKLNVPILVEIEQSVGAGTVSAHLEFKEGESVVQLAPSMLPKGFTIRATYLCERQPRVQPIVEMPDIAIRSEFRTSPKASNNSRDVWLTGAATVAGALIVGVLGILAAIWTRPPG